MVKAKVKAPKGYRDCKGQECDKDYEFEFDVQQPEISATIAPQAMQQFDGTATMQQPQALIMTTPPPVVKEEKPKKMNHEQIAEMIPKGTNFSKCPGEDCDHKKLKNPKQTTKFHTCPGCEANTVPKKSDFCPTCGKNLEDEELEEGVVLESEEEDEDG